MAVFTEEKDLTGRKGTTVKVSTTPFAGSIGINLASRIGIFLLPIAFKMLSSEDKKSVLDKDIDLSGITSNLMTNISEEKILKTIHDLVAQTMLDGTDLSKIANFDLVFAAEYKLLFSVVKFVLEVNYGDFFDVDGIKEFMAKIPSFNK